MTSAIDSSIIRVYPPNVQEVLIGSISDPVYELRTEPTEQEIDELAESLRTNGLIHPIVVARVHNSGFRRVTGKRRLWAAKKLGWKTIPACVIEANESNELILGMAENLDRKDLDPLSIAEAVAHMQTISNLPPEELARKVFHRSPEWFSNMLRVNEYSHLFSDDVQTGVLCLQHCLEICSLDSLDLILQAISFARRTRPRVIELREYVRFLKRMDSIRNLLRSHASSDDRTKLTFELNYLNERMERMEGRENKTRSRSRPSIGICDGCGKEEHRRHMKSFKFCRSCYPLKLRIMTCSYHQFRARSSSL